jgi:hypothetical protein
VVADAIDALAARAVRAAVDGAIGFGAVAYDADAASRALRRQSVDGTLEAIEHSSIAVREQYRECLVVFIAAAFAA